MTDSWSSSTPYEPSKVAAVTFGFWVVKALATTLGETGGDWVSMSLNLGYLVGSAIFAMAFVALVWSQVRASQFRPALFWATIIATTTLGTTMADFADRSVGIGYPGGVAIVALLLVASLLIWRWIEGTVSVAYRHAEGGVVLLVHDPVFPDPWHRVGRLAGGHGSRWPRAWL